MRKTVKIVGLSFAAIVLLLLIVGGIVISPFIGVPPVPDGLDVGGFVRIVQDGYSSAAVLDAGEGKVVLIDAGMDPSGKNILAELERRKLDAKAVVAIFLTHSHGDHVGACGLFQNAAIYATDAELPQAEGKAHFTGFLTKMMPPATPSWKVTRGLRDEEIVEAGSLRIQAFVVPGHTAGSAVYLVKDVLFMGDSADATKDGTLAPAKWPVTDDTETNVRSLVSLANRLEPLAGSVQTMVFSHTGVLKTAQPLMDFAKAHAR